MSEVSFPGIWLRLKSLAYESLLLLAVTLGGWLLLALAHAALFQNSLSPVADRIFFLLLYAAYFLPCWIRGGQTLPMKTWGLRLRDETGRRPVRPVQAVLRYLVAWVGLLFLGIGFWWALLDPQKQFLHDRIAGTRIVKG
jgi:uncharacterized RDD family membrane protein YckC